MATWLSSEDGVVGDVLWRHGKLYIRWYDGTGQRRQQATACTRESEAKAILREREVEAQKVRDGRLPQPMAPTPEEKRRKTITVRELARHFLGEVEAIRDTRRRGSRTSPTIVATRGRTFAACRGGSPIGRRRAFTCSTWSGCAMH